MSDAPSLAQMLAIEDDAALLDFRCAHTGILAWPQVRVMYTRILLSDLVYHRTLTGQSSTRAPRARQAATLARSMLRNGAMRATRRERAPIGIMAKAAANQWIDGRWFNRLADHFVQAELERTLVVEDHFEWNWPFPRAHGRVMLHAPQQALAAITGRLRAGASHREQARRLLALVVERSRRLLDWTPGAEREAQLAETLARKIAALPSQYAAYRARFRRMAPRVLLIEDASYGPASAMIAAARSLGIHTAEFQHGAVSAGHDGYNFGAAMAGSDELRRILPDTFLSYGAWWDEQFNLPVARRALGNPHREAMLARRARPCDAGRDLLILSDGIDFPAYAALAQAVAPAARERGLRVRLRPHPLERSEVAARHGASLGDVEIDANVDLYASLESADTVVSELSTGLFEAVGIAPNLYMWDTQKARFAYPQHPFASFADGPGLAALLRQPGSGGWDDARAQRIWQPGWRENYARFLHDAGVPEAA